MHHVYYWNDTTGEIHKSYRRAKNIEWEFSIKYSSFKEMNANKNITKRLDQGVGQKKELWQTPEAPPTIPSYIY